jgi:hypothetical protein
VVAAFPQPVLAHIARGRLEAEGIECALADENIVAVQWLYSGAVGGVKLLVRESHQERALRILREADPRRSSSSRWVTGDLDEPRCPRCGCLDLAREPAPRWLLLPSWLLLGVPLAFLPRGWRCRHCSHRFTRP